MTVGFSFVLCFYKGQEENKACLICPACKEFAKI